MATKSLLIDAVGGRLSLKHLEAVLAGLESVDNIPDSNDPIFEMIGNAKAAVAFGQLLLTGREPVTAESQQGKDKSDPTRVAPDDEDAMLPDGKIYPVFEHYNAADNELAWILFIPIAIDTYLATLGQAQEPIKEVAKTLIARRQMSKGCWDEEFDTLNAMGLIEIAADAE
jgi:hypothetical protein